MAIYKRGKTYWFEFIFEGRRVRRSAKTSNRRAAEQIEAAYKVKLAKGEVDLDVEKKDVPNFKAAMAEFMVWSESEHNAKPATHRRYKTSSVALLKFFADVAIDKIEVADVERFKRWRTGQTKLAPAKKLKKNKRAKTDKIIKPATVNRDLACLKIFFNYFVRQDVIVKNPVSRVKFLKENNENFVVVTPAEEKLYLLAASQPLQDVAALMLDCGCRPDEIYSLKKDSVNLEHNYLKITEGKTPAARRRIPLTARAKAILQKRIADAEGDYLFAGGRAGNDGEKPIVKLNAAHHGAVTRAKLRKFRLYDLRHTYASRMAMAGVDLVTLAALLGHSRVQMTMRYAHPSESHKIDAVAKLESFNAEKAKVLKAQNG